MLFIYKYLYIIFAPNLKVNLFHIFFKIRLITKKQKGFRKNNLQPFNSPIAIFMKISFS